MASRVASILGLLCVTWMGCVIPQNGPKKDPPKPLTSRPGSPKPWEGTLANGNLLFQVPLSVIDVGLVYNSVDSMHQEGFGFGWRLGLRSTLTMDRANNVVITRPDGTPVTFHYNGSSWIAEPMQFSRLAQGDKDTFIESFMGGTCYVYRSFSGKYFLHQIVDRNGNAITIDRDDQNRETTMVDGYGRILTFHWNGNLLQSVKDHEGRTYSLEFNRDNELVSITQPAVEAGNPVLQFIYAGPRHLLVSHVTPAGSVTTYSYYEDGSLKSVTESSGYAMVVEYTENSVIQRYSLGEQNIQLFSDGDLIEVGTELGLFVHYDRDSRHRITRITDAVGHVWDLAYNDNDDLVYEKDPQGQETEYEYDDNHNALNVTQTGLTWSYGYDSFNELTRFTNPVGQTTLYERDERGNLIKVTDHTGKVRVQADYNSDGSIHTITNMYGEVTTIEYDEYGNITSLDQPDLGVMTLSSTPMGILREQTSSLGDKISFSYDDRAALTGIEQRASRRKDGEELTVKLDRDLDSRVVSYETCGPSGCQSASKSFGPTGNVSREDVNGNKVQDGECPCVPQQAP